MNNNNNDDFLFFIREVQSDKVVQQPLLFLLMIYPNLDYQLCQLLNDSIDAKRKMNF